MIPSPLRPYVRKFRPFYFPYVFHGEKLERFSSEYFPKYVSKQDVILEVGAKRGVGTRFLSELARFVYSFEPESLNFRTSRRFLRECKNVEIYRFAISDHQGSGELLYDASEPSSASLKGVKGSRYPQKETVVLRTLDSFSFALKPTALIVDCEGAEVEVLKGARSTLGNLNTVLVETHPLADGTETKPYVLEELGRHGFRSEVKETDVTYAGFRETWIVARRPLAD